MQDGTRNSGNLWSGLALAALAIYIMVQALQWEYLTPEGPGPGFFPLWYGICMIVLSVLLVATTLVRRASLPDKRVNWGEVGRALAAWTGLALCVGFLKILGFLLAFGLFTFFLVAVMYRRPLGSALAVSVGTSAGFYLLFPLALNVALPVGRLGF